MFRTNLFMVRCKRRMLPLLAIAGSLVFAWSATAQEAATQLRGHIPMLVNRSRRQGRVDPNQRIRLAISLPLRNQPELDALLKGLSTPGDPRYHHYLTPAQFIERFGPTEADYAAVSAHVKQLGLTIAGVHPNRTLLDVVGTTQQIENAFNLHLMNYQAPDNRVFRAPDADPLVPADIARRISGVIGLDTAAVRHSHARLRAQNAAGTRQPHAGTGPGQGYSLSDIKTAYNLNNVGLDGSGQTLGLFELDGYRASDIAAYESYFGLRAVPLQNVLLDGATGRAGSGADEVTIDLELMIALAPGATSILVYEAANSDTGVIDAFNRMANDNLAQAMSVSWGSSEDTTSSTVIRSENAAFQQMAAQGQSIFAAAGDNGAYDNGSTLSVDDPASQPYMVGVGGTSLLTTATEAYQSETTWNGGSSLNGGGGGGISAIWPIPSWQSSVITPASRASTTMRNVPDVALNADPSNGYAIYYRGWNVYGGTSAAAPLWAAFTALVNQQRAARGLPPLGFANPKLYAIGNSGRSATDFHDIADGSTNLYFPAVTGYDDATGLGSFNGATLLADLSSNTPVFDLNGDGKPDILWRNTQTGDLTYWLLNGTTYLRFGTVATGIPLDWTVAGTGDFNGDGKPDILWRNQTTGDLVVWNMQGGINTGYAYLAYGIPTVWQVVGVADLNGDGKVDLLWRNTQTGDLTYWLLNGTTYLRSGTIGTGIPLNWVIAGTADLNGDGKADLLWRNTQTGDLAYWLMNGTALMGSGTIAANVSPVWQVVSVADFNGDGKPDLLWRNTQTGDLAYWLMNGTTLIGSGTIATGVPLYWTVVAPH